MTDDSMIEEATRVIRGVYGDQVEDTSAVARAVLAVFEKAHAPTDDEPPTCGAEEAPMRDSDGDMISSGEHRKIVMPGSDLPVCDTCVNVLGLNIRWDQSHPELPTIVDHRDAPCVAAWPECSSFDYDPRCCRFPKSCSAGVVHVLPAGEEVEWIERGEHAECKSCGFRPTDHEIGGERWGY